MKKRGFYLIYIFIILSFLTIAYADTLPIHVRPLSGGSIQESTAFDYQFNFTSDQACNNVLHSVTETITTDAYGIGFSEIDISPLNDAPSYLCEYRTTSGNSLSLRKVHNISSGLFNRTFGKDVKYDELNVTGNMTLGQKITFSLGNVIKEITGWFVFSKGISVEGDLNVTGDVNVTGYVNASTIYSGGKNVTTLADYAYNQTYTDGTYNETYHGLNVSYYKYWYNYTGTGDYYYNQTAAVEDNFVNTTGDNMTGNLTVGIEQAPGSGIHFGDDYNASIYWNGSNLIIQG